MILTRIGIKMSSAACLAKALAAEVAVQPRQQQVLGVRVGGGRAEREQVGEELRLINRKHVDVVVRRAQALAQLRQRTRCKALLHLSADSFCARPIYLLLESLHFTRSASLFNTSAVGSPSPRAGHARGPCMNPQASTMAPGTARRVSPSYARHLNAFKRVTHPAPAIVRD